MKKGKEDGPRRSRSQSVKAIVFDYGNVIASFDVTEYMKKIAPYSSVGFEELRLAIKGSSGLVRAYETGDLSSREFFDEIKDACSLSIDWDDFVEAYVSIFTPILSTQTLIRSLKPFYRLGLLSNTSELHFQHEIELNPVFPLFDAVTLSFRVRARKPQDRIYLDMLRLLQASPENCIYIDDIPEFADAARHIGMIGIHYTTHDDLLRSLETLGVRTPSANRK